MSYNINTIAKPMQEMLDTMFTDPAKNPSLYSEQDGTLLAITDPVNRGGVEQKQLTSNGKIIKMEVITWPKGVVDEVESGETLPNCFPETGTVLEPKRTHVIELDKYVQDVVEFDFNDFREIIEGDRPNARIATELQKRINVLRAKMNNEIASDISAHFGNYYGGTSSSSSPIALDLIQGSNPELLNPRGFITMRNKFEDIGQNVHFVIGAGEVRDAFQMQEIGCCNTGGADISNLTSPQFFTDLYVDSLLTGDRFYGFGAGTIQMIGGQYNVGEYTLNNELFRKTTVTDPRTGIVFDIDYKLDAECSKLKMWIRKAYTIFYPVEDTFKSTDTNWFGVNGVLQFNATT